MIKDYGPEVQKLYLELMLADAEVFVRCQGIFDHTLFDRKLQDAAEFINEYSKQYSVLPDYNMVNATCELSYNGQKISKTDTWNGSWTSLKALLDAKNWNVPF